MSLLPKIRTKYGEGIGVELFFSFPETQDDQRTFLDADVASGVGSISADGVNFAVGQYIVIGQPGNIRTEIVQLHASSAPTATTITLATNLQFAHNRGDMVRFIPYNQIVPENSTDGVSFSALSTIGIRADSSETYLQRTADTATTSYRFRFFNATSSLYSQYSDVVTATGFGQNTIWSVKDRALDAMGEKKSDLLTDKYLNDSIYEARRQCDQWPNILRWTFREEFNVVVAQCLSGAYSITAPTDLRDRNTYKNIIGIRLGKQFRPCVYQDRTRFNQNYLNIAHTTLNGAVLNGATSIVLTSSHDFDDSGSVVIAGSAPGTLKSTISYTGNNRSTNTLTGVTGVPSAGYITGLDCWQNAVFGLPTAYTIDSGTIYFDTPFYDLLDGRNVTMDYYSIVPTITTDSQTFDEPFYDMYVSWLKWKIKYKKANGNVDREKDPDYQEWVEGVLKLISQETNGQRINFIPDIEGFLSTNE